MSACVAEAPFGLMTSLGGGGGSWRRVPGDCRAAAVPDMRENSNNSREEGRDKNGGEKRKRGRPREPPTTINNNNDATTTAPTRGDEEAGAAAALGRTHAPQARAQHILHGAAAHGWCRRLAALVRALHAGAHSCRSHGGIGPWKRVRQQKLQRGLERHQAEPRLGIGLCKEHERGQISEKKRRKEERRRKKKKKKQE